VQLSRFDEESKTWVKSNTVTITVEPDEALQPTTTLAQNPTSPAPFSIRIWMNRRTTNASFDLDIITCDVSDHVIAVEPAKDQKDLLGAVYKVDVVDSSGKLPPETDLGRFIGNTNQGPPILTVPAPETWGRKPVFLKPGEEWLDRIGVESLYGLRQPGEYTIQVRRWDSGTHTWVKSNKITDTFAP
jgi:hypothetical protein